ncbi:pimeloyl-ACP methyl ester carboxylesterase [Microcella alkaliphila]|uniref:Pimeloyl-ACP methyl ester carboxylesterase n=1 Tax=Microcella alkaliphila TaxID=279828 RepID=A0A4Q7TFJ4_9MICO|nr:alpha/beta hydrolase [Microcella alkaliphila]RZT58300.1 pimeloyl-ACP methyl ester carboxylesterase [Microcella alkaliphila]
MTRRRLSLVSALVASVLLLGGCTPGLLSDLLGQGEQSTPTGEEVEAALAEYYEQRVTWTDCGGGAQCATAIAPLDWNNPGEGDDVELALVRHRATGDRIGSLFVNPGGPGASGFDFIRDSVDFAVGEAVREGYDIVGWDPRGVGRSSAVSCFDDPADMDAFLFGIPENEVGSDAWIAEVTASSQNFAAACAENTGPLLGFVDTDSTVQDLDLLRAVLGDQQLHYLGYSYGTEIGARYADRYPDRVGRLVLDGAIDPRLGVLDVVIAQQAGFEQALRAYLAECPALGGCPFPADVDAAAAQIRELVDRLDEAPLPAADGRFFDGSVMSTAIATALYDQGTWTFLTQLFTELRAGDPSTGFFLADFYYGRENGEYIDNSFEAFVAINCLDYPVETDPAVIAAHNARLLEVAPTTASPSPVGDVLCANWPYQFAGELGPVSAEGAAPILVVGTTGDPATPYEWAVALAEQLSSGVLVTYVGEGHIAYDEGDPCVDDVIETYLLTGAVPDADPQCNA